jgi:hypothetical protein
MRRIEPGREEVAEPRQVRWHLALLGHVRAPDEHWDYGGVRRDRNGHLVPHNIPRLEQPRPLFTLPRRGQPIGANHHQNDAAPVEFERDRPRELLSRVDI